MKAAKFILVLQPSRFAVVFARIPCPVAARVSITSQREMKTKTLTRQYPVPVSARSSLHPGIYRRRIRLPCPSQTAQGPRALPAPEHLQILSALVRVRIGRYPVHARCPPPCHPQSFLHPLP